MASIFKIFQEGKDEIVTVYFPITGLIAPNGYIDCGLYKLQLSYSTPSGKEPSITWASYLKITVRDGVGRHLLQDYAINPYENVINLYIKANIANTDCQVDTSYLLPEYPNGKMLCDDYSTPSGFAAGFEIILESTDETKVIIDSSRERFSYAVTG